MNIPARRLALAAGTLAVLAAVAYAQRALPPIQAAPTIPGEVQAVAPGVRPAPPLARLTLEPPLQEAQSVEYAGNGFIEVAHALLLLPTPEATAEGALILARAAVERSFRARPSLAEVDVSVYVGINYGGFGGPPPLLTASVPRARLADFLDPRLGAPAAYDRLWVNAGLPDPPAPPVPLESPGRSLTFLGSPAELAGQRARQGAASRVGGASGGLFFHGNPARPLAALTFDDTPHPLYEPLLLDLLRRTGAKATFFCIGRNAEAYPYFIRDMARDGHEVANHTYHHIRLPRLPEAQVREELTRTNAVLERLTGRPVRYFRPPGGEYSLETLRIASSLGLTTTFWTDDPGDFANPGDAVLESRLITHLRPGGIVLLHDNAPEAIAVLPAFLRLAAARGVRLTTVSELAGGR